MKDDILGSKCSECYQRCRVFFLPVCIQNLKIKIYITVLMAIVLYGCQTWSLTLRVFDNRVLKRILDPKSDEATGEWRRLNNKEHHDLYTLPNIIWVIKSRRMRWAWHVVRTGDGRDAYRALVGRPQGKRPLGRPRCWGEGNIKTNLQEVGWGHELDWSVWVY